MPFDRPLPAALSPSRLQDFQRCPRKFQHGTIDRLHQPASYATAKGNVIHHVMEHLFELEPVQRTRVRALELLEPAETEVLTDEVRAEIALDATGAARLHSELVALLEAYFEMEDPVSVSAEGVELVVRANLDGAPVLGILDRLDRDADGTLSIVDYKTGALPRREYDTQTFANAEIYAALCEEGLGELPHSIRLYYLAAGQVLERPVREASIRARRRSAADAWNRIERYYEAGEFPATPSRSACRFCAFTDICRSAGVPVPSS